MMKRMTRWILFSLAVTVAAAGCSDDTPDESTVQCERIELDGTAYCTYKQPITETGYDCPQDLPNAIPFDEHTVCSADKQLPEEHEEPLREHFTESTPDLDGGTDTDTDAVALTCDNVQVEWRDFLDDDTNRSCQTDDDCVLVSDWAGCDCNPSLTGSGVGVNINAARSAQAYLDVYNSEACADIRNTGTCDAAPADRVWCDDGTCRANSPSCLPGPDAGNDGGDGGPAPDPTEPGTCFEIGGQGDSGSGEISHNPPRTWDLGEVPIGESREISIQFYNFGCQNMPEHTEVLGTEWVSGSAPAGFSITEEPQVGSTITGGQQPNLIVEFAPASTGVSSGTLHFRTAGGYYAFELAGEGVQ